MIYMYHFWYYPYTNSGIHTKNGTNKPIGLLQDTHFVCTKYHLVKGETPKTPFQQTTASARPYVNDAHRNLTISPQSRIQVLHLCRILILKKDTARSSFKISLPFSFFSVLFQRKCISTILKSYCDIFPVASFCAKFQYSFKIFFSCIFNRSNIKIPSFFPFFL
jgi:hypothetical protein